jgi:hypothetical protein
VDETAEQVAAVDMNAWGAETRSSCRDGRVFVDEAAEEVVPLDATSALLRRA